MKTLKKVIVLVMIAAVVCSLSVSVFAADSLLTYHGLRKGYTVTPGSSYTDTDLFDGFKGAMPGDELTETITIENRSKDSDYINVYLQAVVHDEEQNPLSPNVAASGETVASMTDFLSQLNMIVKHNGYLLYEASPDQLGGLASPVYIGSINQGKSLSIDVTLQIPIDLGNKYANRVGEVDWKIRVESFDYPSPPPTVKQQLTVRKVWNDDGIDRPEQVTVALLRDGEAADTVVLNAQNQWIYTWSELDNNAVWTVEETDIPTGYTATYNTVGSTVTIVNEKEPQIIPETTSISVRKVWDDTGLIRPTEITVDLLRNGVVDQTVVLNQANNWQYAWTELVADAVWTVTESAVPEGYVVSYHTEGSETVITNTEIQVPPTPPPAEYETLKVEKVWKDDASIRPQSVEIVLLRNGEETETVALSADNDWCYTWNELTADAIWTVEERNVPDGYVVSYQESEETVKVINTQIPKEPVSLTVVKVWNDTGLIRPTEISIELLRNGVVDQTIVLSESTNWQYTWNNLSADEIWTVTESAVPEGYVVSYHTEGSETVITNTEIQVPPTPPPAEYETLKVEKVWKDDASIRPQSVEIVLLRNGEETETVALSADNDWCYTWNELTADAIWTVEERNVPDGYVVSYQQSDGIVTVINTQIPVEVPAEPVSLTIVKVWDDAHYPNAKRPDRVGMMLYNGEIAIETVWLGEWNQWTFTWSDLDTNGEWSIVENTVEGYTPYYSVSGETVTVTNTAILLQTGQLKWPIPVFAGCGLLLIGIGLLLLSSKKDKKHAS